MELRMPIVPFLVAAAIFLVGSATMGFTLAMLVRVSDAHVVCQEGR